MVDVLDYALPCFLAICLVIFIIRIFDYLNLALAILFLIVERLFRALVSTLLRVGDVNPYATATKLSPDFVSEEHKLVDGDAIDLIRLRGYPGEEHVVETEDGYILGMQRIPRSTPAIEEARGRGRNQKRPVVFLQHGFMMCSEVWLCRVKAQDNLAFILADEGYDVWLGNVRGNKYAHKHVKHSPETDEFWDFSMDEMVKYDIPSMTKYAMAESGAETFSYVGFSQGTALCFGSLSVDMDLQSRMSVFIALASTAHVKGMNNPIANLIAKSRPELVFLMFGRRSFLSMALYWRRLVNQDLFAKMIDMGNRLLFGWKSTNICDEEKKMVYCHLYSYSPVKALVHWFQIIKTGRFQMYDDTHHFNPLSEKYNRYVVPSYPLHRITCPMAVFYGGKDNLADVDTLLSELHDETIVHEEPDYEHLDYLWARNTYANVYTKIIKILESHCDSPSLNNSCESLPSFRRKKDMRASLLPTVRFHGTIQENLSSAVRRSSRNSGRSLGGGGGGGGSGGGGSHGNIHDDNHGTDFQAVQEEIERSLAR
eukprot:TRINITY_DN4148_c0_g1_i1.p1 TRINITY_DN4148_c0_g1~~TRINITY_DN4148_c0_g1_i1.p1  ORF type:complete len:540 (+),score=149.04 TRINITY_DN4148_c0_g1_i1:449-2068(+)